MANITITMNGTEQLRAVFGEFDRNINLIQKAFSVTIFARGGEVKITGDDESSVAKAEKAVKTAAEKIKAATGAGAVTAKSPAAGCALEGRSEPPEAKP